MDEKRARHLAALCARCCAKRSAATSAHCGTFKCKVVCKSRSKSSSPAASQQQQSSAKAASASPSATHSAENSAAHNGTSSSGRVASPSKSKSAHSSAHKSASNKHSALASVAAEQTEQGKSSSKSHQSAVESPGAISSEKAFPVASNGASAELDGLEPAPGEPERTFGVVVDGLDVAKFRDRDGFHSVNLVRALKSLYKDGMKPIAFLPRSYVDFRSKDAKLADDPCVLKYIEKHGFLRFIEDKELYAWHMLTFAKNNNCPILSNRRYEQKRKVKTPKDVEVSSEQLEDLYSYVGQHRMAYSFKGLFVLK